MAEQQRAVRARLSDSAWEGWDALAREEGVTLTGLIEALGLALQQGWEVPAHLLRAAKEIDRERSRRS